MFLQLSGPPQPQGSIAADMAAIVTPMLQPPITTNLHQKTYIMISVEVLYKKMADKCYSPTAGTPTPPEFHIVCRSSHSCCLCKNPFKLNGIAPHWGREKHFDHPGMKVQKQSCELCVQDLVQTHLKEQSGLFFFAYIV